MKNLKLLSILTILNSLTLLAPATTFYVNLSNAIPVAPYTNWTMAAPDIQSAIDEATNGDLILVSNGVYNTGGRMASSALTNRVVINKALTLESVNGPAVTLIEGNSVLGGNAVRCVYMTNKAVLSGFTLTNGGTLNSGDSSGGGLYAPNSSSSVVSNCVLIGNCAEQTGGGAYNGLIFNSTIIQNSSYDGGGVGSSGSPAFVTNSLICSNSATAYGGGAWGTTLINCVVLQNVGTEGGGAALCTLYGCLVVSNSASEFGGGLYEGSSIINCTVVGNTANYDGGGLEGGSPTVQNSIIDDNAVGAGNSSNYVSGGGFFYNSCTSPMPLNGSNNTTNDPGFISYSNGDFHLQSSSISINSGNNSSISSYLTTDLDGNPRFVDYFVDIGAFEYQTPCFLLPFYWAQQYGLSLDGTIDSDGDGMNNWEEAVAGTNPTNASSVIKILSVSNSISGNVVQWESVAFRTYFLQRSTNLLAHPAFVSIYTNGQSLSTNLSFTDTAAKKARSCFYRVSVQ